jgi:hypothetical protein
MEEQIKELIKKWEGRVSKLDEMQNTAKDEWEKKYISMQIAMYLICISDLKALLPK